MDSNRQFSLTKEEYNNFKAIEKIYLEEVDKYSKANAKKENNIEENIESNILKICSSSQTGDFINLNQFENDEDMKQLCDTLVEHNRRVINNYIIILKLFKQPIENHIHTFIHCNRFEKQNPMYLDVDNKYPTLYMGSKFDETQEYLYNYFIRREEFNYYLLNLTCASTSIIIVPRIFDRIPIVCRETAAIIDTSDFNLLRRNKLI